MYGLLQGRRTIQRLMPSNPRAWIALLGVGVLLGALLLPLFVPLADHHFPEREPGHLHIYPGGVAYAHAHPYALPHAYGGIATTSPEPSATGLPIGIIFLPAVGDAGAVSGGLSFDFALLATLVGFIVPPVLTLILLLAPMAFLAAVPSPKPPPPRLAF